MEPYVKREFENRLCISQGKLRKHIRYDHHKSLLRGHRLENEAFVLIERHFFWPTVKKDVNTYVNSCTRCQSFKANNNWEL